MDLKDKPTLNAEIDAMPITDAQAQDVGFDSAVHYKEAFKKFTDLCDACARDDGTATVKSLLTMATHMMKAVYYLQTKGMDEEQRTAAGMAFFKLAMTMVMESIGGQLLDVQIPEEKKSETPPSDGGRSGSETLH